MTFPFFTILENFISLFINSSLEPFINDEFRILGVSKDDSFTVKGDGSNPCVIFTDVFPNDLPFITLFSQKNCASYFNAQTGQIHICIDKRIKRILPNMAIVLWRYILDFNLLALILRSYKLAVVHGALLELPDGRGVLLSAESGVGKSTTSRRWEASGGKYTSDDMILLEYDTPEGVIAHPLPTWSRCLREGTENLCYPIQKKIPLAGLLVLSRAKGDEPERIVDMTWHEFLCQVYQSVCYFHINLIKRFPEAEQRQLIANNQSCARKLCSLFPPRALMARLDGDLRETLKEFLC